MKAVIVNYRMGRHNHAGNQMVIKVHGVDSKEKALKLVGKTAVWTSPAKKEIKGKISSVHGNKENLRVLFEKGMPGQAISQEAKIE